MGSYHKKVYDDFFKGKRWAWIEYEQWNDICEKMGSYPVSFPIKQTIKDYALYTLLMRTIHFRANSLHNQKRQAKLGIKKHELLIVHNEDKVFY